MDKFRIIVSDHLHQAGWQALAQAGDACTAGPYATRAELLAGIANADALIVRSQTVVDEVLLAAAPRLKVVSARRGAAQPY